MMTRAADILRSAFLIVFLSPVAANSQSGEAPEQQDGGSRLLFHPLRASVVEARMGAADHANTDRLRLDIGNTVDLFLFRPFGDDGGIASAGADFFTWTSLRQSEGFHFPVDAVDYLFGVNASFRRTLDDSYALAARLRLSHISAHLVDGSYEKAGGTWREDRPPRVYSREFIELIAALEIVDAHRIYAGAQYVFHVDPPDLGQMGLQAGGEAVYTPDALPWLHPYVAYDVKLTKFTAWSASHSAQAGVILGRRAGAGLNLFVAVFSGTSQHGEYYDARWNYWGPGFSVEF